MIYYLELELKKVTNTSYYWLRPNLVKPKVRELRENYLLRVYF